MSAIILSVIDVWSGVPVHAMDDIINLLHCLRQLSSPCQTCPLFTFISMALAHWCHAKNCEKAIISPPQTDTDSIISPLVEIDELS